MLKVFQLHFLVYKSNINNYGQISLNKNIILTTQSNLFNKDFVINKISDNLLKLYINNKVSYNTLIFLTKKSNKRIDYKSDYSFLNFLIELSWESGILSKNKKKIKTITFSNN